MEKEYFVDEFIKIAQQGGANEADINKVRNIFSSMKNAALKSETLIATPLNSYIFTFQKDNK